jgi:hypothetical protein
MIDDDRKRASNGKIYHTSRVAERRSDATLKKFRYPTHRGIEEPL